MVLNSVKTIQTGNCGGYGAWIDNPLNSPAPGSEVWAGFQGGGGKIKFSKSNKLRKPKKSRKYNTYKKSRASNKQKSKNLYKQRKKSYKK